MSYRTMVRMGLTEKSYEEFEKLAKGIEDMAILRKVSDIFKKTEDQNVYIGWNWINWNLYEDMIDNIVDQLKEKNLPYFIVKLGENMDPVDYTEDLYDPDDDLIWDMPVLCLADTI